MNHTRVWGFHVYITSYIFITITYVHLDLYLGRWPCIAEINCIVLHCIVVVTNYLFSKILPYYTIERFLLDKCLEPKYQRTFFLFTDWQNDGERQYIWTYRKPYQTLKLPGDSKLPHPRPLTSGETRTGIALLFFSIAVLYRHSSVDM